MKKLNCPGCNQMLSLDELNSVPTPPKYLISWSSESYCPNCGIKLAFNKFPEHIGSIGGVYFIGTIIFNSSNPENIHAEAVFASGAVVFAIAMFIWHKYKRLVKVR